MNKKILISLSVIGIVAAVVIGGTIAYFSDTETSEGNIFTAGIIDIVVDDQNPWNETFTGELTDMKPSDTRYIVFTVRNLEYSNPVNVWKHIDITDQSDGVITEPECTEGGGQWIGGGTPCTDPANCCTIANGYIPRNNLAAYTLYDMYVCEDPEQGVRCLTDEDGKPINGDWQTIISEDQYVRLDNVSSIWIYLGQLNPAKELKVVQSYHLSSWPNAPEPEVTNWAQGDEMTFNIDLMATQLNAPGPKGVMATLHLENKDPVTWEPILGDGISGTLTYNTSGEKFNYTFTGTVPQASTAYCLIYYADPWPGDGMTHNTGRSLYCITSGSDGSIGMAGSPEFNSDLPNSDDQNYPAGAKFQVVLWSDYDGTEGKMTGWNPSAYLFEMNLITYDDTDI